MTRNKLEEKIFLMYKFFKPVLLILIQLLYHSLVYSQNPVSVEDHLTRSLLNYCREIPRDEVYVHTDREEYIAGEKLWFNTYLVDRQTLSSQKTEKILYFELLNQENLSIVRKRIYIDKGFGQGNILLPDTLSPGTYTIRAYTNWMKNFLPANCFIKDISVYNTFSKKPFKRKSYSDYFPAEGNKTNTESGLKFNLIQSDQSDLEIIVTAGSRYREENANTFYIFIQTHGMINHLSTNNLLSDTGTVIISRKVLSPGINHITLFNSKGEPVQEKYLYTAANKEELVITTGLDDTYKRRSKVSLEINDADSSARTGDYGNYSVSVIPFSGLKYSNDIEEYMVLGSEFGQAPRNFLGGRRISDLSAEELDTLLLSLKSNWIDWTGILSGKFPLIRYMQENEDHFLTGSLINRNQEGAGSGEYLFMSIPGKEASFQYTETNEEANFSFNMPIDDIYRDIIIQSANDSSNYVIKLESSFSEKHTDSKVLSRDGNDAGGAYVSDLSVNYQIGKIYENLYATTDTVKHLFNVMPETGFYGKPDINLIMDDYIKLPVMDEVFFELLPGVFLRKKKSDYEISVSDPITNFKYPSPPGLMIDGVIINDASLIAKLDPEMVEKIEVIKDKYFTGSYLFYGIVNVITRKGDFSSVNLTDNSSRIKYRTIDPVSSFVSPDYSLTDLKMKRIPDFRNTLYWNPKLRPGSEGRSVIEFWTSDIPGNYELNIQGITRSGKFISYKKILRVE